jgi:hypothetical protein
MSSNSLNHEGIYLIREFLDVKRMVYCQKRVKNMHLPFNGSPVCASYDAFTWIFIHSSHANSALVTWLDHPSYPQYLHFVVKAPLRVLMCLFFLIVEFVKSFERLCILFSQWIMLSIWGKHYPVEQYRHSPSLVSFCYHYVLVVK